MMEREEFQCKQCFSMLVKVFAEEFEKPTRVVYNCPACKKQLYAKRTTENAVIKLNETKNSAKKFR